MSGGNCPETPRQKMIGMMYLMLTAMLALNVSGDLLNAFDLVDQSIRSQKKATEEKLSLSYYNFESKAEQNPQRVKPKYELALDVKAKSDSLVNYIQSLKQTMIDVADGKGSGSTPENYLNKSDQDKAAQVMMVESNGKRLYELRDALLAYREAMLNAAQADTSLPVDTMLVHSITTAIDAPPSSSTALEMNQWGSKMFEHLPIAAVMGLMSAIQSNVRNVETDVTNYLYKSIDAASYKFNVLVPLVIPEAQYVIQGGQYKADIMLAAYDDTMEPIVSVGGQNLPVEGGRGKYVASASSVGMKNYEAKLQVPDPVTGSLVDYNVKATYEVGAPSLVVSATKMNAMYRGLENPIEVSVAGVSPSDLNASCAGGNMTRSGAGYIVKPGAAKEISISVSSNAGGKSQSFGSKKFRVYDVPDPVVNVTGSNKGNITKGALNNFEVKAELKDFVFDVNFRVTAFTVSTTRNGFLVSEDIKGSKLNKNALDLMRGVGRNGRVYVESVKAVGPDGRERSLNGITLKMQ